MSVTKDKKTGTWTVYFRFTDWQGNRKEKRKRGFRTKKEALEYERKFLEDQSGDVTMQFDLFVQKYLRDLKPQIKLTTYATKVNVIRTHILPYFGNKVLSEISASDILQWQNELLGKRDENGRGYSPIFLKTVQTQLSAIFNHAVRYYGLAENPCRRVKSMGTGKAREMLFWTREEYTKFIETMKDKPLSFYAFEVLYWTGIREGELLGLERGDIDLDKKTLSVRRNYQKVDGVEYLTTPKTEKGTRTIILPEFLCSELEDYFESLYRCDERTRLFPVTKSYLDHALDRGAKESGVKRIRIHDLRHSHVAHLIELGYSPVAIAERMGHESETITLHYAHLYPSTQTKMAQSLEQEHEIAAEKGISVQSLEQEHGIMTGEEPLVQSPEHGHEITPEEELPALRR